MPKLAQEDVALFAVSYDSVEILRAFAREHDISYPLLSDSGSHAMRRLGLLNPDVQADHAVYGIAPNPRHVDLPYPGLFVVDEDGVVRHKRFHESYRVRDTAAGVLEQVLALPATPPEGLAAGARDGARVRVRAWLDSPIYVWFQRLHLTVELAIDRGLHVYGRPIPPGYTPLAVAVEPIAGLEVGEVTWPAPRRMAVDGLADSFWVHEGTIRGTLPLTFTAPPGAGDHLLRVAVRYQGCSETTCEPPDAATFALAVRETALVGRTLPAKSTT